MLNYSALVHGENHSICLVMTPTGDPAEILGWKTEKEAVEYFTGGYNRNHDRGYEPSMSAAVHYIMYQPRIVSFESVEQLADSLLLDRENMKLVRLWCVAGGFRVLVCDNPKAQQIYDQGIQPPLITAKEEPDESCKTTT